MTTDSVRAEWRCDGSHRAFWVLSVGILAASLAYSEHLVSFLHAKEAVLSLTLLLLLLLSAGKTARIGVAVSALWPLMLLWLFELALAPMHPPRVWMLWSAAMLYFALILVLLVASAGLLAERRYYAPMGGVLVISATAAAAAGLMQYAGWLDALLPPSPGYTQRMYSVFGNQDLLGGYVAMGVALALALLPGRGRTGRIAYGLALLVLIPTLAASGSRSAWLACAVGCCAALFAWRGGARRWLVFPVTGGALALLLFGGILLTRVLGTFQQADVGGRVRLWLWDGTLRMIHDFPWLGVGPGNYPYWSPRYLGQALLAEGGEGHYHNAIHTLHAHSEPLQLMAETGVVGLVLLLLMLWRLRRGRGPAVAGLLSLLVFACFNPAFHSAPHLLAAGMLTVMALHTRSDADDAEPVARGEARPTPGVSLTVGVRAVFAMGVLTIVALHAAVVLVPSYLQARGEDAHLAGASPESAYGSILREVSAEARRCYGIALMERGRYREAREALMRARSGLDTGEIYWCLAKTAAELGHYEEARHWLGLCGARWPCEPEFHALAGAVEAWAATSPDAIDTPR